MGLLEDVQNALSGVVSAAGDRAAQDIKGQQTPLPGTVTTSPVVYSTPMGSLNQSTIIMIAGAVAVAALAFFVVKKGK